MNQLLPLPTFRYRKITSTNQLFRKMKYQIILSRGPAYFFMRQWCQKVFGETVEYWSFNDMVPKMGLNPLWSWDTGKGPAWLGHIYLKDDYELDSFKSEFEKMFCSRKVV